MKPREDIEAVKKELGEVNIDVLEEIKQHKQEMKILKERQSKLITWLSEN